jgi:hypothetical protein
MSLASIPSSALPSSALSSLVQSGLDAQLISTNDSSSVAPSLTPAASSTLHNFATDLANIFKDLAANDTSSAQSDLTELQQALGYASNAPADNSPLGKLLDTISASLSSGDTTSALQDLIGFFTDSGKTTGNVVNTYA